MTPVSNEPVATDCARSKPERWTSDGMKMTSSALPSTPATTVRTDWLIVSPVVNALDRMMVPMVRLRVISAAKPGRRGTLRQARRGRSGLRIDTTISSTPIATVSAMTPVKSASCGTPNKLRTGSAGLVDAWLDALDLAVAHVHHTPGVRGDLARMRHQHE